MANPKFYRVIGLSQLFDSDWVADKSVPSSVPNVYSIWPGHGSIEMSAVWWDSAADPPGVGVVVYDDADVVLQPVEVKRVPLPGGPVTVDGVYVSHVDVAVNAADAVTLPAFRKVTLIDTSADALYVRVVSGTPPNGADQLRLVLESTTG